MPDPVLLEEALTRSIIGAFFEVYNTLGFGFLEQVYAAAMEDELRMRGHTVLRELSVNVVYRGRVIAQQRLDMVVDGLVVVENKSTEKLPQFAPRQLVNYLQATDFRVGLLLHFGMEARFHRASTPTKERIALIRLEIGPYPRSKDPKPGRADGQLAG